MHYTPSFPLTKWSAVLAKYTNPSYNPFQIFTERRVVTCSADSGTLVVWSDLDRVEWKQASTTFKHTETLLGRIYRRFLAKPSERLHPEDQRVDEIGSQLTIICIPVQDSEGLIEVQEADVVEVRPNDPLYLMAGTSCPEDFGPGPMFTELDASPFAVPVIYKGIEYEVRVRSSYARAHVRDSLAPDAAWPDRWKGNGCGPYSVGETRGSKYGSVVNAGSSRNPARRLLGKRRRSKRTLVDRGSRFSNSARRCVRRHQQQAGYDDLPTARSIRLETGSSFW